MLMIGKPLSPEQRIQKGLRDILSKDDFVPLSGVLLCVKHQVDSTGHIPTACTNGVWAKYGAKFIENMNDAKLRFLMLHETYHCMYQHMTTWDWMYKLDPQAANQACDHVINLQLLEMSKLPSLSGFIEMPEGGCADPQYAGMDSATVFRLIRKNKQQQQQQGGKGKGGKGQTGSGTPGDGQGEGDEGFDSHDWESAESLTPEERAEIGRQMDEAIRQGALLASKCGSGGDRILGDLLESKIRWQDALREYLQATCAGNEFSTWRKPNRRYVSSGVYMPSGVSEIMGELVIAVDMSGSIGGPQVSQFMGEIVSICETVNPETVRLLYWDTEICQDEKYSREEQHNLVTTTKPAGGGGTSPSCITDYMAAQHIKPQVVVVLTDGFVGNDWGGSWPCPVLWCIVGNKTAQPAIGSAVYVDWNE